LQPGTGGDGKPVDDGKPVIKPAEKAISGKLEAVK
jgi:hypothetical protein